MVELLLSYKVPCIQNDFIEMKNVQCFVPSINSVYSSNSYLHVKVLFPSIEDFFTENGSNLVLQVYFCKLK